MKLNQNITLALGLLTVVTASQAQSTTSTTPVGVIGQQYTELSFGLQDLKGVSAHGQTLEVGANTPYIPGSLDTGASYSYSWIGGATRGHANTIGAYATAYAPMQGVKPFVSVGLGWQWSSFRFVGRSDQGLWAAATGVEIPAGVITITPRIAYADDFESSRASTQSLTYQVEANHWLNKSTAVFGSIGFTDVRHSAGESWNYQIGLRARF